MKVLPVSRDLKIVLRELAASVDEFQLSWVGGCEPEARWMAYAPNVGFYFSEDPRDALQLLLAATYGGDHG